MIDMTESICRQLVIPFSFKANNPRILTTEVADYILP